MLGQNTPPIPVRAQQKFKDKLNAISKPSSWSWTAFKNGARTDDLELHHWVKGLKEKNSAEEEENPVEIPYKFEKYNVHLNIPDFTEEDYNSFIAADDKVDEDVKMTEEKETANTETEKEQEMGTGDKPTDDGKSSDEKTDEKATEAADKEAGKENEKETQLSVNAETPWDYEETRYLFDLSKSFDLKWIVIHDRYSFKNRQRSVEDLQERFYSVCQTILIHDNEKEEGAQNSNLISNLNFNKKKEIERKAYLNRLLARSPAEIAEEESLIIEAKKFELAAKKTITERTALLQLLDSPQASASISQYLSSQGLTQLYNTLMTEKRKKRTDSPIPENPLAALNEKLKQQHLQRQKQLQMDKQDKKKDNPIQHLISKNLTPREEEAFGLKIHQEKIAPGVYLRSSRMTSYKPGVQVRINAIMGELGLGKKPTLSTEKVIEKQEQLMKSINQLLELKRQVDKLEAEAKIVK